MSSKGSTTIFQLIPATNQEKQDLLRGELSIDKLYLKTHLIRRSSVYVTNLPWPKVYRVRRTTKMRGKYLMRFAAGAAGGEIRAV
jgi:hypothetical protein